MIGILYNSEGPDKTSFPGDSGMCGHLIHKGEVDPNKAMVVERQSGILWSYNLEPESPNLKLWFHHLPPCNSEHVN